MVFVSVELLSVEPDFDSVLADPVSDADVVDLSLFLSVSELSLPPEVFFCDFLSLKSVSYQPPPFSLKAAAVTIFRSLFCLHAGHSVKSPSETF